MIITIVNCHIENRGDEAAIHALVDELISIYPDAMIYLLLRGNTFYPNMPNQVKMIKQFVPGNCKSLIAYYSAKLTNCRLRISSTGKSTMEIMKKSDIIVHAPGGPSIGDIYYEGEPTYLRLYDLAIIMNKPYMFYAPSMGPFERKERNGWRKRVLEHAEAIVLRDPISAKHVSKLMPESQVYQTLDSAFQHDIDIEANQFKLDQYSELSIFLKSHSKCVGVTITDLLWHPVYSNDSSVGERIRKTFLKTLEELVEKGYGIVFIPQLYGKGNDYDLMSSYCANDDYYVITANDDRYDTYFQQFVISKLYAVIGMRYHSNIFSAKMGTPFISVSYEQKMQGFMEKMELSDYCLKLEDLNPESLLRVFNRLENDYANYRIYLENKHDEMRMESYKTTKILIDVINRLNRTA